MHPTPVRSAFTGSAIEFVDGQVDGQGQADELGSVLRTGFFQDPFDICAIKACRANCPADQAECEQNLDAAVQVKRSNYEGPASILSVLANHFEAGGSGTLVSISSVAGYRGRATNYVYGSAKAGLTAFMSGLRNRLAKKGVHVITVLPGYVATKLTDGMDPPARLTAQPEEDAAAIEQAVRKQRGVIYVRPKWQLLMPVIRNISERIFKEMKI